MFLRGSNQKNIAIDSTLISKDFAALTCLFYCSDKWAHKPAHTTSGQQLAVNCLSLWVIILIVRKVFYSVSPNFPPCV